MKTEYKIVFGKENDFLNDINKISKEGYICSGSIISSIIEDEVYYSQLMVNYLA